MTRALSRFSCALLTCLTAAFAEIPPPAEDHGNRFGIASGAEWSGDYPRFLPMLKDAGMGWIRYFREWHGLQPKQGEWDWKWADEFVGTAKKDSIQVTGLFCYFAPWASSGGDSRTFPVKDMQYWRDYVSGMVAHFGKDIRYWEVWNEPQNFQKNGTPQLYADLVREAYVAAKKADPQMQIGITVASNSISYLDKAIKAGAADHFDYVCVHPYENVEQLTRPGGEVYYLSIADNLRRMLAANKQRADLPLWITEIGWQAPIKGDAEKERTQAEILVKVYVLSFAQGFRRVCWFEARGPAYGKGTDHGLIRTDWTPRPALAAMKTMVGVLGESPTYLGWVNAGDTFGFVFEGKAGPVLAAWAPVDGKASLDLGDGASLVDLAGQEAKTTGGKLELTNTPVFVTNLPARWVSEAKTNAGKPFPWGGDFAKAASVVWKPGSPAGLEAINPPAAEKIGDDSCVRVKKGTGLSFRVNPTYAGFGDTDLEIKVVARRAVPNKDAGLQMMAEVMKTSYGYDRAGWWTIPADDQWHENVWRLKDANFVGVWAYNFTLTEISGDMLVKEVSVRKVPAQ